MVLLFSRYTTQAETNLNGKLVAVLDAAGKPVPVEGPGGAEPPFVTAEAAAVTVLHGDGLTVRAAPSSESGGVESRGPLPMDGDDAQSVVAALQAKLAELEQQMVQHDVQTTCPPACPPATAHPARAMYVEGRVNSPASAAPSCTRQ